MLHIVMYPGPNGEVCYQQALDADDAVAFVESLRNTEGVDGARIFRAEEVAFEYKVEYVVELVDQDAVAVTRPVASAPVEVPGMEPVVPLLSPAEPARPLTEPVVPVAVARPLAASMAGDQDQAHLPESVIDAWSPGVVEPRAGSDDEEAMPPPPGPDDAAAEPPPSWLVSESGGRFFGRRPA